MSKAFSSQATMMSANYGLLAFDPMRSLFVRNLPGTSSSSPEHSPLTMSSLCGAKNYSNRAINDSHLTHSATNGTGSNGVVNNMESTINMPKISSSQHSLHNGNVSGAGHGHSSQTSTSSEKDFLCELCGKRFTQKGNLKTHIRSVHTKEKPFTCPICGKTFSQKGNMQTHVRTHNKDDRYPCNLCGNLKTHMQRHAGTLPPSKRSHRRSSNNQSLGASSNLHYGQVLDLGQVEPNSPSITRSSATDEESSSSPLNDISSSQHTNLLLSNQRNLITNQLNHGLQTQASHQRSPLPSPSMEHESMPFSSSGNVAAAAARALYSQSTQMTNSLAAAAHSSSWLATNHPANLSQKVSHSAHQPRTSSSTSTANSANPYDPFSSLANHPYSSFAAVQAASPLSRLSLFSGMAAGMPGSAALNSIGAMINGSNCVNSDQANNSAGNVSSGRDSCNEDTNKNDNSSHNRPQSPIPLTSSHHSRPRPQDSKW